MPALDWKKTHKSLYFPPADPVTMEVPQMNFLMIDGHGDPNNNPVFSEAVEALYSLSYTLKFGIKKDGGVEYGVFPLEGLWWAQDMDAFTAYDKSAWDWTLMIAQPEPVTAEWVERARAEAIRKKKAPAIARVRFKPFQEGLSAQLMHSGSFAAEGPNIARLHAYIESCGGQLSGKHHEIYLSDFNRTAPEKLKTVIRQPFARG